MTAIDNRPIGGSPVPRTIAVEGGVPVPSTAIAPVQPVQPMQPQPQVQPVQPTINSQWHPTVLAFMAARGKTRIAAEDMGLEHDVYILELTNHMDELGVAVRAITLLDTFDLAAKAKKVVEYKLDDLKGQDLVKLYADTVSQIERLTTKAPVLGGATTNNYFGNIEQKVIQNLPPHVQAAYMKLRDAEPLPQDEPSYTKYDDEGAA